MKGCAAQKLRRRNEVLRCEFNGQEPSEREISMGRPVVIGIGTLILILIVVALVF